MAGLEKRVLRFGVFEADTASGELRKTGVRLRLQDQAFQVLVVLLERSGDLVTREELRQKLWPEDTFVDFDHSLNTLINKLREALGDSASNPRFIETLAKRGYRFLVPVELAERPQRNPPVTQIRAESRSPESLPSGPYLTQVEDVPHVDHGYVGILILLIQIMYLSFYVVALARLSHVEDVLEQVFGHPASITAILIVSAAVGIPIRLYLLTMVSFNVRGLRGKFLKLFPVTLILDELWALAPFLLAPQIGIGLALAATAALIYVPFSQRTLVLMRERALTK